MSTGEKPIQSKVRAQMNALAAILDDVLNGKSTLGSKDKPEWGFALLVFAFGDDGTPDERRLNYVSNADRKDMLTALKEFIARNEGRYHEPEGKQ